LTQPIRIGLAGTGFGRRVMLPAFAACEGVELAAVCSATAHNAKDTAQQFNIAGIYTDFDAMLDSEGLDLIVIATPPHLHWPMVKQAAEKNVNILCEKPTAMNANEARSMLKAAQAAGVRHWIDHELRFHPTLFKLKSLVEEGFLGDPASVSFSMQWCAPIVLGRPWFWWFDEKAGGGLLGAIGSHQVDLIRWVLDTEFSRVSGVLKNFLPPQPDARTKELKPVTSDNYCAFSAELTNGAVGVILLDATARFPNGSRSLMEFHGGRGSLIFDGDQKLWAIDADGATQHTQTDPLKGTADVPDGIFPEAFVHFSRRIVEAVRNGADIDGATTFADGLQIQSVLDAVRNSHAQGGWVEVDQV